MNHLATYEQAAFFDWFRGPRWRKFLKIIDYLTTSNSDNWLVESKSDFVFRYKDLNHAEIESVKIKLGLTGETINFEAIIQPKVLRSKSCKELFKLLRSRTIQVTFDDQQFIVAYKFLDDYRFSVRKNFALDPSALMKLQQLFNVDWQAFYDFLMKKYKQNDLDHKLNTSRISRFFGSINLHLNDFSELKSLATGIKKITEERHKLTQNLHSLDPKIIFTFLFSTSNLLPGSKKELIITRKLVSVLETLDNSLMKLEKQFESAKFSVFIQDRVLTVNIVSDNEETVKRWQSDETLIPKYFVELEDKSRNISVEDIQSWSEEKGYLVFSGVKLKFTFQTLLGNFWNSPKVNIPLLLCNGRIDGRVFKGIKSALRNCEIVARKHEDITYIPIISGGCLRIILDLDVTNTWHDETLKNQLEDEDEFD